MSRRKSNKGNGNAHIYETSKNPAKVHIKSDTQKIADGWTWVRIDSRTEVLRKPKAD